MVGWYAVVLAYPDEHLNCKKSVQATLRDILMDVFNDLSSQYWTWNMDVVMIMS